MDPLSSYNNNVPYAVKRFQDIVEERYFISKQLHTSYIDVGNITPIEREHLLKFIERDMKRENEMIEQSMHK